MELRENLTLTDQTVEVRREDGFFWLGGGLARKSRVPVLAQGIDLLEVEIIGKDDQNVGRLGGEGLAPQERKQHNKKNGVHIER